MNEQPPTSAAVAPEDMLEDTQDVRVINGVEVRKGTLGAFMINASRLDAHERGSAQRAEIVKALRRQAPAVRALGVLDAFTPKSPELRQILDDAEAVR